MMLVAKGPMATTTIHVSRVTQDPGDVVMPGAFCKDHLMLQVPQQPRKIGCVDILEVLTTHRESDASMLMACAWLEGHVTKWEPN